MEELDELLKLMVSKKASDLHLRSKTCAVLRIDGKLKQVEDRILSAEQTEKIAQSIMNPKQREIFAAKGECDLSYSLAGVGRFRGNIYRQRGSINIAMRYVPVEIRALRF